MSQNKIGVSRKMSIEYPYKQLPCQTQGGFLQTALSAVTRRSRSCSSPVLLRRVTPDRVLAFIGSNPAESSKSVAGPLRSKTLDTASGLRHLNSSTRPPL